MRPAQLPDPGSEGRRAGAAGEGRVRAYNWNSFGLRYGRAGKGGAAGAAAARGAGAEAFTQPTRAGAGQGSRPAVCVPKHKGKAADLCV